MSELQAKRVEAHETFATDGAKWLDERLPGWAESIDVENLAMLNSQRCILGQLFGANGYGDHYNMVGGRWIAEHGFASGKKYWEIEIEKRLS